MSSPLPRPALEIRDDVRRVIITRLREKPRGVSPNVLAGAVVNAVAGTTHEEVRGELQVMQADGLIVQETNRFLGDMNPYRFAVPDGAQGDPVTAHAD